MAVKALQKALSLLSHFATDAEDLSVAELSQLTGLNKGQVSKVLATFRESGLLKQDMRTRRYSVGLRAFMLGSRFANSHVLAREAVGLMRQLVDRTGHSVRLCVMDGTDIIYLYGVEGPFFHETGWRAGTRMPFHATAAGKAFVAFLDEATIDRLIAEQGLPTFTPNTIRRPSVLKRELAEVRLRGYSRNHGELNVGLGVVGVPVFDGETKVIAVLTTVFPERFMGGREEKEIVTQLHDAARVLSSRMGCHVYPFGLGPRAGQTNSGTRARVRQLSTTGRAGRSQ